MTEAWATIAVAFLVSLPGTLTAYAALRKGREIAGQVAANDLKTDAISEKTDAIVVKADLIVETAELAVTKTDALIEKTAEIHTLANSTLSETTAALAMANEKIRGMERTTAAMEKLLAAFVNGKKSQPVKEQ